MRKLFTTLALLVLAVGLSALSAHADGTVDYTVTGTFGTFDGLSSTSQSNVGDSFTFTFSVSSTALGTSPIGSGMSPDIGTSFDYTDLTNPSFDQMGSGVVNFFTAGDGGLFIVTFNGNNGDLFTLNLFGLGCGDMPPAATCAGGFTDGTPPTLTTGGPFAIDPTGTVFGEIVCADITNPACALANSLTGSVTGTPSTAMPEPSSLVLLGSGFLALGGFARKRLIARFN